MTDSATTVLAWISSTAIVALVLGAKYFELGTGVPVLGPAISENVFELLLSAYTLLWAGTIFSKVG